MAQRLKTDWILFTAVVLMVLFGAVMIYSASSVVADMRMGSSYYFALRQLIWIAIAIPMMMFLKRLNYRIPADARRRFHGDGSGGGAAGRGLVRRSAPAPLDPLRSIRRFAAIGIRQARAGSIPRLLHRAALASHQQPLYAVARVSRARLHHHGGGGGRSRHRYRPGLNCGRGVHRRRARTALYRDRAGGRVSRLLRGRGGQAVPAGARDQFTSIRSSGSVDQIR